MDRRSFLKFGGFITASVATGGLAGCGSSDAPADPSGLPPASGSDWKFPQSVASGDPRPDSIMLWTRVVPAAADAVAAASGSAASVTVRLLVSSGDNAGLLGTNGALAGTMVSDERLPLQPQFDNTIRHKLSGLQAGSTYYYQFVAGDVRSNVGRFRTAPAAGADVARLQFAYMTCQDWSINHWGAMTDLAAQNLDFIIHLGDYIYETVGESFQTGLVETRHDALKLPDGTATAGGGKYATTLADYRYLYKKYRTDSRLQALHERFAFIAIWDDHEFSDDSWGDAETYAQDTKTSSGVHQTDRRRSASQAWFEYMPADVSFDSAATGFQNIKIYRDFQFGKLMQLVMTDERLYRADHVIPEPAAQGSSIGSRYFVPQDLFDGAEAQKMAASAADPLAPVSMLGNTQRSWWMDKMKSATQTWKLWGNEVSLLRMGLNGTDAIATLLALQAIPTLATSIGSTAAAAGGNVAVAGAIVAAATAGAAPATAQNGAVAIATAFATGGTAEAIAAAAKAGLTSVQASIASLAFITAQNAAAGGAAAQATAAAQVIAIGYIKPDVQANKANSPFVIAAGQQAALGPYFRRFLLNCDQWDGYNSERKALLQHLKSNRIGNVVALTGDIHSFFAGTVNDDFDAANGGTPVMVDLVSAGISSDSFFVYMSEGAAALGGLSTLVAYPLTLPVPDIGAVSVSVNLLDYTMGKASPTVDELLEQIRVQLRGALAAKGVPEVALDDTVAVVQRALRGSSDFSGTLLGLAQQLAGLNSNPWLRHLNTDAQGYTLVTLTPDTLTAQFRQVNKLVGGAAPVRLIARTTTATVPAGTPSVAIS